MTTDSSWQSADPDTLPAESKEALMKEVDSSRIANEDRAATEGTTESSTAGPSEEVAAGMSAEAQQRRKIQIGSRLLPEKTASEPQPRDQRPADRRDRRPKTGPRRDKNTDKSGEETVEEMIASPKVPPPSRRDKLPSDLEDAFKSALAGASMDDLLGVSVPASGETLEVDSKHRATVMKIHGDNVFCSIDGRNEAVASLRQFPEPPEIGSGLEVVVRRFHAEDGLYEVSVSGGAIDVHDWSDLVEGALVEARITGSNVGGLECMVGGIRGFIPASQIDVFRVEHYADYYEKKLPCVVTEANPRRRNLVLSHRAFLEREREQHRQKLLEELDSGQVREGVVSSVRDFGVFVDLGGVDGLIPISRLSWDRIDHPSEVLEMGQQVRVKIEKVNRDTGKISLSYRDLLAHPWSDVEQRFPLNATVKGTVTRIAEFGAFVKIAPGVEGLIHISELAHHRVVQVRNVVKEGEEVEVKIVSADEEKQRIGLSLKAAHPLAEAAGQEGAEAGESPDGPEPPPQPSVKPHQGPLRGGTDRRTGGEDIGLRW